MARLITRRTFLNRAGIASAMLLAPGLAAGQRLPAPRKRTLVQGRVESNGKGVAGVRVSDGLGVALTDGDGDYSLVTDSRAGFVWVSVPDGFEIPISPTGTASFFQRLPSGSERAAAVFDLKRVDPSTEHAFFVLADPQTQDDYEIGRLHQETVPDIRQSVSELSTQNIFGVSCGDIMYDNLALYPQYEDAVQQMGIPFFQVVGNHDLDPDPTDEESVATFTAHFGPAHYSFDRGEVHYVVLDDVFWFGDGYIGYVDLGQLQWLEHDLQTLEQGRAVVLFAHIPLLSTQYRRRGDTNPVRGTSVSNRDVLYRLLEPFDAHVMTGHTHEQEHVLESGVHEHVHGAVCGAWWSGDICFDGAPNGYGVYEVNGSSLRWRYKATGLSRDHQIRAYAPGADPRAPDEVVANVWGWDPAWSVFWYENGERRGQMSRRIGTDPMSERIHRGIDLPARRPWVEPVLTNHLFYCPRAKDGAETTIEAVDRWGNTFTAAVPGA